MYNLLPLAKTLHTTESVPEILLCAHSIFVSEGSGQFLVAQVGSAVFGLGLENYPLKLQNFSIFFPLGQKKSLRIGSKRTQVKGGLASYLLGVKVCSGRVGSEPICNFYPSLHLILTLHLR